MDAFSPTPPEWTQSATHAFEFACPACGASSREAQQVWLNRRSPVYGSDQRKKWQEFYLCNCQQAWWAWSSDRPRDPSLGTPANAFDDTLDDALDSDITDSPLTDSPDGER